MNKEARIEIANRLADQIQSGPAKEKANVWSKGGLVRVYVRKGFIEILENGTVDISSVGGFAFQKNITHHVECAKLTLA